MPRQSYTACPDISFVDDVKIVGTVMDTDVELGKSEGCETIPGCSGYSSMVHSKKVIKHALRQQAKRRRKNTTIAAGNSRALPRIVVKPLPPPPSNDPPSPVNNVQHINTAAEEPAATMREVLASLPGFSLKSGRRRSTKRLSATAQLEAGLVDLESPASILASTSLRALLNRHTFQGLPPLYQRKLAQLLPTVDRQDAAISGLNNEFFARACLEWRKRLAEGEFTPENQQRLKMEAERDKNKLDPWKVKHFEPIWGEKREPKLKSSLHYITESRSSGAVTRSSLRLRLESNVDIPASEHVYPIVMTGDKVDTSCKTEISIKTSDNLANSEEVQQNLMGLDYNTLSDNLTDEKHLNDSIQMNSIEIIEDIQIHETKTEGTEKITDICKEQDIIETNDISRQLCQDNISNIYEEETDFSSSEKNLQPAENNVIETLEEDTVLLPDDNSSPRSNEQVERVSHTSGESISQLSNEYVSQTSIDQIDQISKEQISQMSNDQIYQISDCKTTSILESSSPKDQVRSTDIVIEDTNMMSSDQTETAHVSHENPTDSESQIPEGMEIDSETLQRIHELEVRGEMREMYEEISGCPEEIIYPILEGMEMTSTNTEVTEPQVSGQTEDTRETDVNAGNEDEALREANNYVCSEMLECSWTVDPTINNINNNRTQEELQVPWPLVAAALDGSVAANITVTTQDECSETSTTTDSTTSSQQFINANTNVESVNCIQLPVVQGTTFQSDGLAISTPGNSCVMKNLQSQSPPIITFPQLQSIRFVQTSFNPEQDATSLLTNNSPTISAQLQPQQSTTAQINMIRTQDTITQINTQNSNTCNNVNQNAIVTQGQVQNTLSTTMGIQSQNRTQNAIVIQHQTAASAQPRQIAAAMHQQQQQQQPQQQQPQQQQQYAGSSVTIPSRSSRVSNQGSQRGSRNNKEQGGSRSRSSTKEPPGAVNLERSYQICQAVIQSSPNRDQLKAHLKPPPSLLARGDGAFTTSKSGGRTLTTVKPQKTQQAIQHNKQAQNKTQAVMLRHVFATARQATSTEVTESTPIAQLGSSTSNNFGQYILVQRTGVGDGAPRASSAPPLPPQIAGMGVGVHLVRGRPASAGEGSHQAVTLKARGADSRVTGGAEPGAPGMIIGGDPPPPCECNMRGAMVICRQCGAFCHDDCIGPQRICATCLIR
ncbi:polycomb protein Asx-like isoform X1 [Formica exsecta]|uniref:polycomb protein Asx-like isoform X1 n=1 Tax=Formica exsecta TaxID=72781 RepID=UPI0011427ACD|nr:polycomb protein Asx-like isoform X1 [Formica exsecta]XP_029667632.1 polycomb protein Asx-like isoform X1 [Formica exsecta]XP_029667633.1 polycomb protein Asx-like isoform X1 [Formica exsecta]